MAKDYFEYFWSFISHHNVKQISMKFYVFIYNLLYIYNLLTIRYVLTFYYRFRYKNEKSSLTFHNFDQ